MKKYILKPIYFALLVVIISSCDKDSVAPPPTTNEVIEEFRAETGLAATYVIDTRLLENAKGEQGNAEYPGVDNWATAKIPIDIVLFGGLPGRSTFYTIRNTVIDADTIQRAYWEMLQVKEDTARHYRKMVGLFKVKGNDPIIVAISKVTENFMYGAGGAWQIYVEDYGDVLIVEDAICLRP